MFEKLRQSKLMYWSVEALIIVLLVIGLSNLSFLATPIATLFSTLLIPFVVAGFLYYLFNPLIELLQKLHIKRNWAIALVFLIVIAAVVFIMATIIPNLVNQVTQLVVNLPKLYSELRKLIARLATYRWYKEFHVASLLASVDIDPSKILSSLLSGNGLPSMISSVVGIVVNVVTIPVLLFYFLKDGKKLVPNVQRFFPTRYNEEIATLFSRMNATLSHYIAGQAIE